MATSDPEKKRQQLIELRQFRDLPEALLAKSVPESAGIECFLGDETMVRMDWLWSNLLGGVKLWVRQTDADAATDLLNQSIPEGFEVEGVGEYKQPRCPHCQSVDVSFEAMNKPVAYGSFFLGVPFPLRRLR
jgi:hypothetical protein